MLHLMLGNSPDAFACGEVHAWYRPHKRHHFIGNCRCGRNPCPVWERIRTVPERQFYKRVIEELKVGFIIDSSKELGWLIDSQDWAIAGGIKVLNLVLWKDPIDLAYSHWKRGEGLNSWRRGFVNFYKFFQTGCLFDPYISVTWSANHGAS